MPPAGFELEIPASERPQTHALDRMATGIGPLAHIFCLNYEPEPSITHSKLDFSVVAKGWLLKKITSEASATSDEHTIKMGREERIK